MMKSMFQYISVQFSYQKTEKERRCLWLNNDLSLCSDWKACIEQYRTSSFLILNLQNFKLLNTRMTMKVSGCCWYFGTKLVIRT